MEPDPAGPAERPQATLRIDYHVHTRWSYDSDTSLEALIASARRTHLSHVCITDHDTIEGALALQRIAPPDLAVIVGCEVSTDDGSQVLGIGIPRMLDVRQPFDLMRAIRDDGGLVLVPHPFRRGSGLFRPESRRSAAFVDRALALIDLVECFNGRDTYDNNRRSLEFSRDRGIAAVAGSDAHTAPEVGSVFVEYGTTEVQHGRSARTIWYADRPVRHEHPVKRTIMEFYHGNATRLPGPVRRAYRFAYERRSHTPQPSRAPQPQHELPAVPGDS